MKAIVIVIFVMANFSNIGFGQGTVHIYNTTSKYVKISMSTYNYQGVDIACKSLVGYVEPLSSGTPTTYEVVINPHGLLELYGYEVDPPEPGYPIQIFNSWKRQGLFLTGASAEVLYGNPENSILNKRSMWGYFKITLFNSIPGTAIESFGLYTHETNSPQVIGGVSTDWKCHNNLDYYYGTYSGVIIYNGNYDWDVVIQ